MEYKVRIPNSVKKDIEEIIEYYFDRITSYNVCYTKLLRWNLPDRSSFKQFPVVFVHWI